MNWTDALFYSVWISYALFVGVLIGMNVAR
jgi:hypothetical protein